MLAAADFLGADLKELFKTASVPALRWWLQFRSLVNSIVCMLMRINTLTGIGMQ